MSREQMQAAKMATHAGVLRSRMEEPIRRAEAPPTPPEGPIIVALGELRRVVGRLEDYIPALSDRVSTVTSRAEDVSPDKKLSTVAGGSSPMVAEIMGLSERVEMATDSLIRLMSRVEL